MTNEQPRTRQARSIYERWQAYLWEARSALPPDVDFDRILHHAITQWREHEPPELAFVTEELTAERRETRHETTENGSWNRWNGVKWSRSDASRTARSTI